MIDRQKIQNEIAILDELLNIIASGIGSLTNPTKLANTFLSEKHIRMNSTTIDRYLGYFADAFLIRKANRYDVKGKKHMQTPVKL